MHLLTKIFIVLVSLLAVVLVPLVVVYAYNEDNFKSRYLVASGQTAAANQKLESEQIAHAAKVAELQGQIADLSRGTEDLVRARDQATAEIRTLQKDRDLARTDQAKVRTDLAMLASAADANQQILQKLLAEVQTVRAEALSAERKLVELDEELRDKASQLDVAVAARRAMHEELQQLKEESAKAREQVTMYQARFGSLEEPGAAIIVPVAPQIDLDATVLSVQRGDQVLAEINAGSRDGVKEGWEMDLARNKQFLAKLRIIRVDINRATGIVQLEDPKARGLVQSGDRAIARAPKA